MAIFWSHFVEHLVEHFVDSNLRPGGRLIHIKAAGTLGTAPIELRTTTV